MRSSIQTILLAVLVGASLTVQAEPPRNIMLFIGDGMGFEQVEAARNFLGSPLSFELFPDTAQCATRSADSSITDSAAAGTALATGIKVDNGVISMAYPGDGRELQTLLEYFKAAGKSVGLVTTTYLTHATPASFGAHEPSRNNLSNIAYDLLNQTRPDVLFGGGANGLTVADTQAAGYTVVTDKSSFLNLDSLQPYLSAQFGSTHMDYKYDYLSTAYTQPTLPEMVDKAIDALSQNPNGFFLMVEGGRIDHACHDNNLPRAIHETIDFSEGVAAAWLRADAWDDTLILVTADHETGGLTVDYLDPGMYPPNTSFSSGGHTGVDVPVYAWGVNSELVTGVMDNTDMVDVCLLDTAPMLEPGNPFPRDAASGVPLDALLSWTPGEQAVDHEVYLGTDPLALELTAVTQDPWVDANGLLGSGTAYFWQVVEVGAGEGRVSGPVWSFTTTTPPEPISMPYPLDGAIDMPTDTVLFWEAGSRTEVFDVYFGTDAQNLPRVAQPIDGSYQPGMLEEDTSYYWFVNAVNTAGTTPSPIFGFTTASTPPPANVVASSEATAKGVLLAGSLLDTQASDNTYEVLQEGLSNPNKNGYSLLEHTWTFQLDTASSAELYIEAFHDTGPEGDDFILSYSLTGETYTDMLHITKILDTDTAQIYIFPEALNGTVYVRVTDTDHSKGNKSLESLWIDQLYILASEGSEIRHYEATAPHPTDGAQNVTTDVLLSWAVGDDALTHNVYFGDDREYLQLHSLEQAENTVMVHDLLELTTYYWRIDEVREGGLTAEGPVWLFTTKSNTGCLPTTLEFSAVTSTTRGSKGMEFGTATVTVQDNCGEPVSGALVDGHFTGDFNATVQGVTDAQGTVVFQSATQTKRPTFGFEVDSVTHPDF